MPAKPTEKQITFFLEAEDRNQFQQLCKTTGISASMVLRSWVLAALKEQRIEMNVTPEATTTTAPTNPFGPTTNTLSSSSSSLYFSNPFPGNSPPFRGEHSHGGQINTGR